ncbi:MAG: hypothetical protein NTW62_00275 [Candidatus Nomurabacteria bacterium]|nr:hypothetical protein [Candidatus Nomurabacteria bacterium]
MNYREVFKTADLLLSIFIENNKEKLDGRKGIVLVLKNNSDDFMMHEVIGEMSREKEKEKFEFACEKISRLVEINKYGEQHLSSFQSEDIPNKKFGGAIKTADGYISASGFPPDLDHKFVLLLALMVGEIGFKTAAAIEKMSLVNKKKWVES